MESNSTARRMLSYLKSGFKKWLVIFAIAFVAAPLLRFIFVTEKGLCSAVVTFSYDGLEAGLDPEGNLFDPLDMKADALVQQAAEAALGGSVTPEDTERIQGAITIQGNVPNSVFEDITTAESIYAEELSDVTQVRNQTYFPSQYTIILHCADAELTEAQGTLFLEELLKAYEKSFYESYGYHSSFDRAMLDVDYGAYDYVDTVSLLESRLSSIRAYVTRMAQRDNVRFSSEETGYSFGDLIGAIDTIQSEDVQWLNSYIISNNMTKDKDNLIDYYQYKIEDAERTLEQQDSRLYALNELIDNYVKTSAIFPNVGVAGSEQETASSPLYEFSQPSEMYDSLIAQKVSAQTSIAATQEEISLYQRRIERLRNGETSGSADVLETRLNAVYDKIEQLLENIRITSEEFFKTVKLNRAFQTLAEPSGQGFQIVSSLRRSIYDIRIVESALFGVYILSALYAVYFPDKRKASDAGSATENEMASK